MQNSIIQGQLFITLPAVTVTYHRHPDAPVRSPLKPHHTGIFQRGQRISGALTTTAIHQHHLHIVAQRLVKQRDSLLNRQFFRAGNHQRTVMLQPFPGQ